MGDTFLVTIKISPYFTEVKKEIVEFELKEEITADQLLKQIGIKKPEYVSVVLNGQVVSKDVKVKNKDNIEIYPIFGGG
ncbi:MAG: hypothetical protein PWP21_1157 [Thermosediminibacterales bacterium]|nr:hypothetical protein [Thermosediminibacterales bacterium]